MLEHEYTVATAAGYGVYLAQFLRWPVPDTSYSLEKSICVFLNSLDIRNMSVFKLCRASLYLYFMMITGKKHPKKPPKECNPEIEALLKRFYNFSVNIKRIRPSSAIQETALIRGFLEHITANEPCHVENITAHNIREFVAGRLKHLADSSKGRIITAIRNFFRFQKFEGRAVHDSIFCLPLSPAVWRNAVFPKTMNEEVFSNLHEIPKGNTPTGIRDRCIILCFTELALRCIEVSSLAVDDFNWHEAYVAIKNTKNHLDRKLPVSGKLGQAIAEYLRNSRPKTTSRILFVRFKHNCGEPMGASQIRGVVRRVYEKAGAGINSTGTHILRRTAATKIYNAGNSLKMTADILGHESLDSTVRYVKTDIKGLRQAAAPWPQASEQSSAVKAGTHDIK
jgi:site-specific recombinase XerD